MTTNKKGSSINDLTAPDWLYRTAIHEAGHFAIAMHLRVGVTEVTVRERGNRAGSVTFGDVREAVRNGFVDGLWLRKRLLVVVAGAAAETVHLGDYMGGVVFDFREARRLIRELPHLDRSLPFQLDDDGVEVLLKGFYDMAVEILKAAPRHRAVRLLAKALVARGTMTHEAVIRLFEGRWCERTERGWSSTSRSSRTAWST